jgi:tRNA(fMet)-specific endonuclease VapC
VGLILDTNAISAAADENLLVAELLAQANEVALPVVAIGEYRYGISQSRYKARYWAWLDEFIRDARVLQVDELTTRYYAAIRVELRKAGKPIPTNDLWISALCRQHGSPLLSRDRHFDLVPGIDRIEW